MINTPIWGDSLSAAEQEAFFSFSTVGENLPVGRVGKAEDVAHAVTFLMQNRFTTGAVLDIDGSQRFDQHRSSGRRRTQQFRVKGRDRLLLSAIFDAWIGRL